MLKTKKILFSLSTIGILTITPIQAFATEDETIQINLSPVEEVKQRQFEENLVSVLKKSKNKEEQLETYMDSHTNEIQEKIEKEDNDDRDSLLVETDTHTYPLDENSKIIFSNQGIILDEFQEGDDRPATLLEEETLEQNTTENRLSFFNSLKEAFLGKTAYAASAKTKYAHNERTLYSFFGTKVATASIGANFTYDGKKVTARITHHYIKRNFDGFAYSIYDKSSGVDTSNSKKRTAFQEGIVSYGLAVNGVGLTFEETFLRVNVHGDYKGRTYGTSSSY